MSRDPSGPSMATDDAGERRRAARYVLPVLAIGVANLVLLLRWGLDPLWAFAILPPMVFLSGIGWVAFRHGFDERPADSKSNR